MAALEFVLGDAMRRFFPVLVFSLGISGCFTSSTVEVDAGLSPEDACDEVMMAWMQLSGVPQFDACSVDNDCTFHLGRYSMDGFCDSGGGGLWEKDGIGINVAFEAEALALSEQYDTLGCFNPETDYQDGSRGDGRAICYPSGACGPETWLHCGWSPEDAGVLPALPDAGADAGTHNPDSGM